MVDSISASRIIYIGETQDNIEAHKVQLQVIRFLAKKYPVSIAAQVRRN
jgi:uncharacterized iron-regulated protein